MAQSMGLVTSLEKKSPCKVNLLLNILGKRPDGFHALETIMHPVPLYDRLIIERKGSGIELACTDPTLPTDSRNLVYRAAQSFLNAAKLTDGLRIHLEKTVPLAAGLGGGSANAATTLLGLNEMFNRALHREALHQIAASIGSDVPFFLQCQPALATGRGEQIESLPFFPAMNGAAFLLVHPGFGISTAWAYGQLARFPAALNGKPGRARALIAALENADLGGAGEQFYNSLEAPALEKYPLLAIFQEFFRANGACGAMMSGSGSATFAVTPSLASAETLAEKFKSKFGETYWMTVVPAQAGSP
jgi:4-diphosphocytidyl-2-C-methyl-D-erythritol kinase